MNRVLDKSILMSIVIPVFNEFGSLSELFSRLDTLMERLPTDCEIVIVNDGSSDDGLEKLVTKVNADYRYRIIDLSRNFGHQMAVSAGLSLTRGSVVGIIDADLQDPPELFIDMLGRWAEGVDVVYGQRRSRAGETVFKRTSAFVFYRLLNWVTSVEIPKDTGDFRLIDRKVVDALNSMPEHHRFLRGMVAWLGFRQEPMPYDRVPRMAGSTKYPLRKMVRLSLDAMFSFSTKPLRWMALAGLGMTIVGFAAAVTLAIVRLMYPAVFLPGMVGTQVAVLTLFGFNFLCLGILGEYLGRAYVNIQGRPHFVVKEVIASDRAINRGGN